MQKEIKITNHGIAYELKISRRAKHIRLSVAQDSSVMLTVPWSIDITKGQEFFESKIAWVLKKLNFFKKYRGQTVIKSGKREYLKFKHQALGLAEEKVKYWNQFYNFAYNRISIRNQKTRWGSASKKGNLNFNYKIVHLPENLLDYLVVHELCHLKELSHSKNFWALVSQTIPDYKIFRMRLRSGVF